MALGIAAAGPAAAQEPDRIFDKSTVWRPLTPNDKLVVYGVDDPAAVPLTKPSLRRYRGA